MERYSMWRHLWKFGHSIEVRKFVTAPNFDVSAKGWLYVCDCGKEWAR